MSAAATRAARLATCADVEDVADRHSRELGALPDDTARHDRLCELNVIEQALSLARTTFVRDAWAAGKGLSIHSWIYGIEDGLLRDLGMTLTSAEELRVALTAPPAPSPRQP